MIPGGLTTVIQPVDVCFNKIFEDYVRADLNDWIMNGNKTYIKRRSMQAAPSDVCVSLS